MKVLTKNVEFIFKCVNEECPDGEKHFKNAFQIGTDGIPPCPGCGHSLAIESECIIKN